MKSHQAIVLSGGGAKGPYGLGVLLALEKFHKERGKTVTKIYCGASVGALNATVAAQGDLKQLGALYSRLRTQDVIGTRSSRVSTLGMLKVLHRKPFHYFKGDALRETIERHAKFDRLLTDAHLLICATNYTTGDLETFYHSTLVDEFRAAERQQSPENRRMPHYHRIESQEGLIQALLATTAVPFYLPPVKIGRYMYVDGGVGNNTPLRQAAYVCRFLSSKQGVQLEPTVCVINDPVRFTIDEDESTDIFGVIRRTMDIFHNALVSGSQFSWERINRELKSGAERKNILQSEIDALEGVPGEQRARLAKRADELLQPSNLSTVRLELPLLIVRPGGILLDDFLCFDPKKSKRLKENGVADFLALLQHKDFITDNDRHRWCEQIE